MLEGLQKYDEKPSQFFKIPSRSPQDPVKIPSKSLQDPARFSPNPYKHVKNWVQNVTSNMTCYKDCNNTMSNRLNFSRSLEDLLQIPSRSPQIPPKSLQIC